MLSRSSQLPIQSGPARSQRIRLWAAVAWVLAIAFGLTTLNRFQMTPGKAAAANNWPNHLPLTLAQDRLTLIMFVHPACSCSDASMEELSRVTTVCKDRVAAYVVFVKPIGQTNQWAQSSLWKSAGSIPGVHLILDDGGIIAARFDAQTSGQVDLFDPLGRLLFTGGITGSRGHAGDNAGASAVVALVDQPPQNSNPTPPVQSNVYGCSISDPPKNGEPLK